MPPVRTNKQSASPVHQSPVYVSPTLQLNPLVIKSSDTHVPPKKKRSHGKARPPGHVRRPPNAFIIFRTEFIKSMSTQNSTPEVSKNLGERWRQMSPSQKQPWVEKAQEAKIQHQIENPNYKYKPIHPRDEFGNCIRKPRKPNRPRANKSAPIADALENLSVSFQWMEGKRDNEFPNSALPSDASSASSPPPSPSPAPSAPTPAPRSVYQNIRRSSSVPLLGPDDSFFGMAPSVPVYPLSAATLHQVGHGSRRLSKRPSTSMDFMCAGPSHPEMNGFTNDMYLSPGDPSQQWRPGHRRSISAPGIGADFALAQFPYTPTYNPPHEANTLTPINPVFGNVFDRFSWNTTSNTQTFPLPADYSGMQAQRMPIHPYTNSSHRQQEYITVEIPSMSNSPTSNISSALSPPVSLSPSPQTCTPAIQHPAPIATFNFAAFQAQMSEFDATAAAALDALASDTNVYGHAQQDRFDEYVSQGGHSHACGQLDANGMYASTNSDSRSNELQFYGHAHREDTVQNPSSHDILPANVNVHVDASTNADLQGYEDGLQYAHAHAHSHPPEITPPCPLDFNELIVESY